MKEITSEELASSNGKDGKPIYIAHQGKVYDVSKSKLWAKGLHMNRHPSGKDLSAEISAAPHGPEVLERYPQVALLKKEAPTELNHLPPGLQTLFQKQPFLKRHPHPMVVHFPIAFLMAASLFALLHVLFKSPSLELTGFYLLLLGAIATPFAVATGTLTWWVNYQLKQNRLIRRKIELSAVLLGMEIVLIVWRGLNPGVFAQQMNPVYLILMVILTPVVSLIGYYGGQLTFPE